MTVLKHTPSELVIEIEGTVLTVNPRLWPEIRVKGDTAKFIYVTEAQRQRFLAKNKIRVAQPATR